MTPPSIVKKFFLTPVMILGSTFLILTSPLLFVGSSPIQISSENEPIFSGKVKDIAAPYLGLATLLSLGTSVGYVAVRGWRQSAHQAAITAQQMSVLEQELQAKETELVELKASQLQLMAEGLDGFLE
ncbi:hypothetical protein [Coleofasciculus sp. E1-EBD-02]|uniref:hypothetical protein n=1 Tax=Coleofasciculus sp. E1-EBD-02 TaxID=3068481 RepID=UPI0032F37661